MSQRANQTYPPYPFGAAAGDSKPSRAKAILLLDQLTLMSSRIIQLITQDRDSWHLAGDQFFVDMHLSQENLPAGTRVAMGSAIIEVTPVPHTGCKKFVERFGVDAMKFVNSPIGKQLNLRGVNAKVIQSGSVRTGERAIKL